jgi:hypothetical protein
MPIEPFETPWADTGTREPLLSDAKRAAGFVGGDQPPIERFNQIEGESQDKLNEIIQERVNSHYDGSADHQFAISTGIWPDAWAMGGETANTISAGGGKAIRDLAVIFTDDGYPRLLLLDNANTKIEVWDPRALSNTDTSDALTDDLPSGGGETWECVSMATDGTSAYCTFKDTNATPDEHQIQAWDITTWNVKTGWPATGTALSGTGNGPIPANFRDSKVIIADSDNLAVSCGWVSVTAAGDAAIQLFSRDDGSAVRDGAGDCSLGGTYYPCEDLVSDGTNIFFIATNAANGTLLCTATIADLTTGTGGTAYPSQLSTAAANGARLCMIGSEVLASITVGDTGAATTVLRTHNAGDATLDDVKLGIASDAAATEGDELIMDDGCWSTVFDGIHLWALTDVSDTGSGNSLRLVRTDAGKLAGVDTNIEKQWTDIADVYYLKDNTTSTQGDYQKIVFDGRDVWGIDNPAADVIYRLPLALLRG